MTDWAATYHEHGATVRGYLRRRTRASEEAQDLSQETFVRAMAAEGSLRDPKRMRAYLLRIAHNLLINHQKRVNARMVVASDLGEDFDLDATAVSTERSPEADLRAHEWSRHVRDALSPLPADQRHAFELAILENLPYREICSRTGWSLSKVKIDVFRARKAVVEALAPLLDEERRP